MKKWMNRIGIALVAASALAMVASDAFAETPRPSAQSGQKFYLTFDLFSPRDITCAASGPGVRTRLSRNLAGAQILRVTGNARGATITCRRPDGSHWITTANQRRFYSAAEPVRATVLFREGQEAMTVLVKRGDRADELETPQRLFTRVQ